MTAAIELREVSKHYPDGTVAVDSLSLSVATGSVVCLVGPSGCGKSTTVRMINRLIEPTSGTIVVGGEDVTAVPAQDLRRGIGYVIQHVGLFPHRNVAHNVGTVPRLLKWPKEKVRERSAEVLELVGLDPAVYGSRYPHELSGGERQRVGVARALAAEPPVLLMDEPFGAVDPQGRRRLQQEFASLQDRLGTTVVMVTHDMREAMLLADTVVVMSPGARIEQQGTPQQVTERPANAFVEDFLADFGT